MYTFFILTLTCCLDFLAWPRTSPILRDLLGDHWSVVDHRYTCPAHLAQVWWVWAPAGQTMAAVCHTITTGSWLPCPPRAVLAPEYSRFLGVELSSHGYFPKHAALCTEISKQECTFPNSTWTKRRKPELCWSWSYNWLLIWKHFLVYLLKLCSAGSAAHTEAYTARSVPPMLGFLEQLHFPLHA